MLDKLKQNKMYLVIGIFAILFIVIILVVLCIQLFSSKRLPNYERLESKIHDAGLIYFDTNKDRLPSNDVNTVEVDINTLVEQGLIKPIEEIVPDEGVICSGKVIAKNTNNDYINYETYIDCGDKYKTISIADKIKTENDIVSSGDGLYEYNGELVYRGENVKNYVNFSGRSYRIVSINEDNTLTLIENSKTEDFYWDNRYNPDSISNDGKNDYSLSRMREGLLKVFNSPKYFSDNTRKLLEVQSLCIGKVDPTVPFTKGDECGETFDDVIGLLSVTQFTFASLDPNCIKIQNKSCQNYNYLAKYSNKWWLLTTDYEKSYKGLAVSGSVSASNLSQTYMFRDVIKITNNAVYVSGDGSSSSPYEFK